MKKLLDTQEMLQAIISTARDALIIIDHDGKISFWNSAAEQIFGYTSEEIIGRDWHNFIVPDKYLRDHLEGLSTFKKKKKGRFIAKTIELTGAKKNGRKFPLELTLNPIQLKEQRCMIGAIRDITAHKKTEKALLKAHDKLERRVKKRTADLKAANNELMTFTYIVSHDLRAPLVNLKGFASELRMAIEIISSAFHAVLPHLDEQQKKNVTLALKEDVPEAIGFIESSVDRMSDFINAILKLSRLGHRELCPESINMDILVRETLKTIAHQIEQRHVKIKVESLPDVEADLVSMEQIMGNILTNAVMYLDPDRPGEIEITGERGEDRTTFHIRDNGRGIAKTDMHKVFEPFRRAGRQDVAGEGMGLAYVQTILRSHSGRIWCKSKQGEGTTFSFTLPHHPLKGDIHARQTTGHHFVGGR